MKHPRRNRISIFKSKLKRGTIMTSIKDQINSIIANRKLLLPKINERLNLLAILQKDIGNLSRNISFLGKKEGLPDDIKQICDNFEHNSLNDYISDSIEALKQLKKRYNRSTINIGVAGKARVGKSTFLQTLSGLTDTQIPTGSGLPVTATRSRIFNSSNRRAIITFYSEYEFCNIVLKSFFDELELHNLPQCVSDFENYNLPRESELEPGKADLLLRLEKMQKAIFSFKDYLDKGSQEYELEQIKPFVSYPSEDEEYKDDCKRPYLAVKDVRIECSFPENDVENLGIMDLPGLGENVPKEYMSSFMDYKSEVDLIILLTKPTDANGQFEKLEVDALNCAYGAKGAIKHESDYVLFVINNGGSEKANSDLGNKRVYENVAVLENNIKNRFNKNGVNYLVLKGDVKDPIDLRNNITSKILEHLTESLPRMDSDYEKDSIEKINAVVTESDKLLKTIKSIVLKNSQNNVDVNEIADRAEELQEDLAVELQDLLQEYNDRVPDTDIFEDEVKKHCDRVQKWIETGLGYSTHDEWITKAKRLIKKNKGSGALINNEFNKLRNYINHSYSEIDKYLEINVKKLRKDIAEIIKKCTRDLVNCQPSDEFLKELSEKCCNTYNRECLSMKQALDTILNSNIEYRSHFHPKVRAKLQPLYADNNKAENVRPQEDELENLYNYLKELAEQVNQETMKAIMEEANLTSLILASWLEDFEDKFIRDKDSDKEFRELVSVYKEQIWPDDYNQIISFKEDLSKLNKITDATINDLNNLRSL